MRSEREAADWLIKTRGDQAEWWAREHAMSHDDGTFGRRYWTAVLEYVEASRHEV